MLYLGPISPPHRTHPSTPTALKVEDHQSIKMTNVCLIRKLFEWYLFFLDDRSIWLKGSNLPSGSPQNLLRYLYQGYFTDLTVIHQTPFPTNPRDFHVKHWVASIQVSLFLHPTLLELKKEGQGQIIQHLRLDSSALCCVQLQWGVLCSSVWHVSQTCLNFNECSHLHQSNNGWTTSLTLCR